MNLKGEKNKKENLFYHVKISTIRKSIIIYMIEASVSILLIILLIVFVGISYLIGKVIYGALGRAGVPQRNILEDMALILFGGVVTLIVGLLVDFVIKLGDKK